MLGAAANLIGNALSDRTQQAFAGFILVVAGLATFASLNFILAVAPIRGRLAEEAA